MGIIPARAGFTAWAAVTVAMMVGSSPLARGLHDLRVHGGFPFRIIPARAGFTASRSGAAEATRDHPRSRGVYQCSESVAPR